MLNGIHLVDFGNHRDTRLTFGRITALVGQNGAGKTNVMRAIMRIDRAFRDDLKRENGEKITKDREILRTQDHQLIRRSEFDFKLAASWRDKVGETNGFWGHVLLHSFASVKNGWLWRADDQRDSTTWMPDPRMKLNTPHANIDEKMFDSPGDVVTVNLVPWVGKSKYVKTAGSYLQNPSYSEDIPPMLSEDCSE